MRVRAVPRVRKVHPLGKQTAMQRHHTVVMLCNFPQHLHERGRQHPVAGKVRRRQLRDESDDLVGRSMRGPDLALQVVEQVLARVVATQVEEAGHIQAIRLHVEVVRNDDARHRGLRLVEHAQLPQVVDTLRELPIAVVHIALVEVTKPNTARAVSLLKLDQPALDIVTIRLIETPPHPLADSLQNREEVRECELLETRCHLLLYLTDQLLVMDPICITPLDVLPEAARMIRRQV
mmetsp:Transcript_76896/g.199945  ORF Transcript_76896/g.199945 Transcript_76896/m.199945 type:complete len:235 (-) Transcript_76896:696-1400(-)